MNKFTLIAAAMLASSSVIAADDRMFCKDWGHTKDPEPSTFTCAAALIRNGKVKTRQEYTEGAIKQMRPVIQKLYATPDPNQDIPYLTKQYGLQFDYCQKHPTVEYWDAIQAVDRMLPCPRWWIK